MAALAGAMSVLSGRVVADGTQEELLARTGRDTVEEAFVSLLGSEEGLG